MEKERIFNLPNVLSGYRIVMFPFILYLIYAERMDLFLIFLGINFLTDVLDGAIARAFNLQTKFGARLDSIGDATSYILVGYGMVQFKWNDLSGASGWLWLFLVAFSVPYIISYLRFRKFPSLHLYSCKIGGTADGVFLFHLFVFGFSRGLLLVAIGWGVLSFLEMSVVLLLLRDLRPDCKGVYWVLRNLRRQKADDGLLQQVQVH